MALSLTDGVGARGHGGGVERRAQAAIAAARELGFTWLPAGDLPDNAMDSVPLLQVVRIVESAVAQTAPSLVYTHHGGDLNIDHQVVCRAVLTACRPQPHHPVREIRAFEVASSTEWSHPSVTPPFEPSVFVEITQQWPAKLLALQAYAEEMRPAPHARSLERLDAQSRVRGAQVGLERAEAFMILRHVLPAGGRL